MGSLHFLSFPISKLVFHYTKNQGNINLDEYLTLYLLKKSILNEKFELPIGNN